MTTRVLTLIGAATAAVHLAGVSPAHGLFLGDVGDTFKKAGKKIKDTAKKTGKGIKDAAKKAGKGLEKAGKAVRDAAAKAGHGIKEIAENAGKKLAELGKVGLEILEKLASEAWRHLKKVSCEGLMDKLFDKGAINRSSAREMGAAFYAGKCGQEFTKGLLCSIPDLILHTVKLIGESAEYSWKNKKVCIGAGLLVGGLGPQAAGPILLCGAGFMLKDKLPKAVKCVKTLFAGGSGGGNLGQTLIELGCNLLGSLVVDVVIAIVTGGAAGPPLVAKKIGQFAASLSAKIPATLARNVAKVAKIKDALGRLKIATQTLDKAAACKF